MKKLIMIFIFICVSTLSFSQADAILTYTNSYSNKISTGETTTTIYESQARARVESTNATTSSSLGPPKTESQNILLFDFSTQKETHLTQKMNRAVVMPFIVTTMEQRMMPTLGTDYVVKNLGAETVNGYKCVHFQMTTISSKNKNFPSAKKDIWITDDLGKCNLFYVNAYLYLPLGSYEATKLTDAGGTGIVVKWQVMDPISNQPNVCTLVKYKAGKLSNDVFSIPSNYTVVQQ